MRGDRVYRPGMDAAYVAALMLAGLAIASGLLVASVAGHGLYLAGGGLALGAMLVWARLAVDSARRRQMLRLAAVIEAQDGHGIVRLPPLDRGESDALVARLHDAIARALVQTATPARQEEIRLAAVIAALPQAVMAVNRQGLVTLANQPATALFGGDRLAPGTSIFDVVDREGLAPTLEGTDTATVETTLSLTDGRAVKARVRRLADHGGAVLVLDGAGPGAAGLAHALHLHEPVPARRAPQADTPLLALSAMALDCESTGLNVGLDRIVSIGAVRLHGPRIVGSETIDALIDPGQPIPAATTSIHGIDDATVRGAPGLREAWPKIEPLLRDCVIVGHNIGFDLTLLEVDLRRAGIRWQRPPSLCTLQLSSVLLPQLADLNLDSVAAYFGITIAGRHTALGDSLVTAEIYLHLVGLLRQLGDTTFGQAQARAARATSIIRQQQEAGW